jgi:Arc/MetJ-type ribon-helix-helix transcriptional regulator
MTITLELPDSLEETLDRAAARYGSRAEAVKRALLQLESPTNDVELSDEEKLRRFREKVAQAEAQIERGEFVTREQLLKNIADWREARRA